MRKSKEHSIRDLRKDGLVALGTFIGPLAPRKAFLTAKIARLQGAIDSMIGLPKQHFLLLLRGSIHLLLRHLLRQLEPRGLLGLWDQADRVIHSTLQDLASRGPGDRSPDIPRELVGLPAREGGFGIPIHMDLAQGLYQAAKDAARGTISAIAPLSLASPAPGPSAQLEGSNPSAVPTAQEVLANHNKEHLESLKATLHPSQLRALQENTSYLGRKWLQVLPTQKTYAFADLETTEAIRSRALLPIKPLGSTCSHCGDLVSTNHEDTCKAAARRWIARHNQLVYAFRNALSTKTSLEVETEPLIGPNTSLRADFSAILGTSRYFYDVKVVAINASSAREEALATLAKAADDKRRKYASLGPFFHPIVISAGGLMEKSTAQTYKSLQKLIGPSAASWLDTAIGLALTKTRAASAASITKSRPQNQSRL
jgi:hypothetical protein